MKKAVFLDRDGVINVDTGYVSNIEEFQFRDGIFELCRSALRKGYCLVVVTNQAGIGRGYYTESDYEKLTRWMLDTLSASGISIESVYHCPHHPDHGLGEYKKDCPNRKPRPGMLLRAARELSLSLSESLLIGDKETDIEAGQVAGLGKNILIAAVDMESKADNIFPDLETLLPWFEKYC